MDNPLRAFFLEVAKAVIAFLSTGYFKNIVFPVLSAAIGIRIKYLSRPKEHRKLKLEDFAVGLDLCKTAILIYVAYFAGVAAQIQPRQPLEDRVVEDIWIAVIFMPLLLLVLRFLLKMVSEFAWEEPLQGDPKLTPVWVFLPLVFGIAYLVLVLNVVT